MRNKRELVRGCDGVFRVWEERPVYQFFPKEEDSKVDYFYPVWVQVAVFKQKNEAIIFCHYKKENTK